MITTVTTTDQKEQKKISWGLPSHEETSLEDFKNMVTEAECTPGYTFDEYTNKVNQWLRNKTVKDILHTSRNPRTYKKLTHQP